MATVLSFDEINSMMQESLKSLDTSTNFKATDKADHFIDDLLSVLILCYYTGVARTERELGEEVEDSIDEMHEIIFARLSDGLDFEDRVRKHVENGDDGRLLALAESEAHRVTETAAYRTADRISAEYGIPVGKRWDTMQDDRVRDTHDYLQGNVVPLQSEFYTYDGDHAFYPGGFEKAENNVNCRCGVTYVNLNNPGAQPVIGQGRP